MFARRATFGADSPADAAAARLSALLLLSVFACSIALARLRVVKPGRISEVAAAAAATGWCGSHAVANERVLPVLADVDGMLAATLTRTAAAPAAARDCCDEDTSGSRLTTGEERRAVVA